MLHILKRINTSNCPDNSNQTGKYFAYTVKTERNGQTIAKLPQRKTAGFGQERD